MTRTCFLVLLLLLVFSLALPLAADPVALALQRVVPDTTSNHARPVVSAGTNGRQFFLAWEDRVNPFYSSTASVRFRTYAADGAPQQSLPRTAPGLDSPVVLWTGAAWLVVSSGVSSRFFTPPVPVPELYGAVVLESGDVVGDRVTVGASTTATGYASAAWNGNVMLASNGWVSVIASGEGQTIRTLPVAYWPLASAGGRFLVLMPVTGTLAIVDGSGDLVRGLGPTAQVLAATAHGDEFALLVNRVGDGLTVVLLDTNGDVKSTTSFPAADHVDNISAAAIAWSGDGYVAAVGHNYVTKHLCVFRASGSGGTTCTSGFAVSSVSLAATGNTLLIAWSEEHQGGTRLKTEFVPAWSLPLFASATDAVTELQAQTSPSIASDPTGLAVTWTEPGEAGRAVVGGIDGKGAVRAPRAIGTPAVEPLRIARGATSTMAVWSTGGDAPEVVAQEMYDAGFLGVPVHLGSGKAPSVAFDGDDWLVAWTNTANPSQIMTALIRGRLLSGPLVRVLSPSPNPQLTPAVASRGSDFLVAWQESGPNGFPFEAALVDREGFTASPAMRLAGPASFAYDIEAAGSGNQYLVGVQTNHSEISLTPSSTFPGILVIGSSRILRIHPRRDGGFAVLSGENGGWRFTTINTLGDFTLDTLLPLTSGSADFLEENGRVHVAYATTAAQPQVLLETFTLRRRVAGMR